ncbi:hypothetical protein NW759_005633 [Fusarium solani]|nr:hypothetical protein NW759_005633 [Fusarium solani]
MNDEHQRDNNVYGPSASPQLSACISAACWALRLLSHNQAAPALLHPHWIPIQHSPACTPCRSGKAKLPWHGTQPSEREAFCGWKRGIQRDTCPRLEDVSKYNIPFFRGDTDDGRARCE